jgi:D-alanyl-D-alanine carboxypeptidase/D-alanyl-D-alanine-endopeptidase (penicillin-binding protein 4)
MVRSLTYWRLCVLALAFAGATPVAAQRHEHSDLQQQVEAVFAAAGPGARFGLVVAGEDGRELVSIAPDQRFTPASNTKILTTAAAFTFLAGIDQPDTIGGASVRLDGQGARTPDVVLKGYGDARLSSAADCVANCLAALADAVAAKTRIVRHVIGDASHFPDQRWSPGMSWNNIPTRSGTAIAALSLDDNEVALRIAPAKIGAAPSVQDYGYFQIENRALTVAAGPTSLAIDRLPGSNVLMLTGTIATVAEAVTLRAGIDDPAHYAAWRFKALLESRGVRVIGSVSSRYRPYRPADDPAARNGAPPPRPPHMDALAKLQPLPLADDLRTINKVSQNVHAELMLRRIGGAAGTGSIADGVAAVKAMMEQAGVPRTSYDLADGSGMSTYNRVAPRGMVKLLRWIAAQPWGATWRDTLPIGGVDGTLAKRFSDGPLAGRLFAKTGTLNATNALSGYLLTKSGRTLIFSSYVNDVPEGVDATKSLDDALELIASAN